MPKKTNTRGDEAFREGTGSDAETSRLRRRIEELERDLADAMRDKAAATADLELAVVAQQQSDDSRRRSEETFRNLVETSAQGIVVHKGWTPLFANQAYADLYGYDDVAEIVAGGSIEPMFAPHEIERLLEYRKARLVGRPAPSRFEVEGVRKDGSRIWTENTVRLIEIDGDEAIQCTVVETTRRKEAERALRESEARFWSVLDNSPTAVFLKDLEGRFILVSKRWERRWGIALNESAGKTAHDFLPKDQADIVAAQDRIVIEAQEAREFEFETTDLDGNRLTIYMLKFPVLDGDGKMIGIGGIGTDISERKRAEEALRESEGRFKDYADTAADWFWEMGPDLRFSVASERVEEIFGETPAAYLGNTREELAAEAVDNEKWRRHLQDLRDHKPYRDFRYMRRRADGRILHVSISGKPVFGEAGEFLGYRGSARDVTGEIQAEEALRKSEERFRSLFENAPVSIREEDFSQVKARIDGLAIAAHDEFVSYLDDHPAFIEGCASLLKEINVNQACLDLHRIDDKQVFLDTFAKNFTDRALRCIRMGLEAIHRGETGLAFETDVTRADGSTRDVAARWSVVPGHEDTYARTLFISIDITDVKQAEKVLRDGEERQRRFAGDVAHELRTPLAVLRSNLDSLEDSDPARSLRADVEAMSRLVEQLLVATRLDFLAVRSADDEADLHEVCTNVAALLAPLAIKEKQSIQVIGSNGPVIIKGNRDTLEQALRNLVENALYHSGRGSTVTLKVSDDAKIRVIDKGPGIPPQRRDKIFDRFVRGDRKSDGVGLGLSIVRRTVEAHDGGVEISDTPGGGATFTMSFPAAGPGHASTTSGDKAPHLDPSP